MGATQAQRASFNGEISPQQEATAAVLGIPEDTQDSIFNTPELARIQICRAAELILENHSTIISRTTAQGRKDMYRVSLGNEHFPVKKGILENTLEDNGVMPGFNLRQRIVSKNQDMQPIYLVTGDVIERPVVTIMPATGEVYQDSGLTAPLYDAEDLRKISEIISAIGLDSSERHEELKRSEEYQKEISRSRRIKRVSRTIGAAILATGLWFATPPAVEGVQNWRQERAEQEAEQKAAERATELQQQAEAKQAREERETAVRNFDSKYDIDPSIIPIQAGVVGVAQATEAFIDIEVPSYGEADISQSLARDLSSPRSISIPEYSLESSGYREVSMPIEAGQGYRVTHNGSATEIVNVRFNPATNKLEIGHSHPFGASERTATEIYIQSTGR